MLVNDFFRLCENENFEYVIIMNYDFVAWKSTSTYRSPENYLANKIDKIGYHYNTYWIYITEDVETNQCEDGVVYNEFVRHIDGITIKIDSGEWFEYPNTYKVKGIKVDGNKLILHIAT